MDDLGNIIYLIVIVFAGIAGIIKKVNKKQETYTSTIPDDEHDEHEQRDIFKDIFGDEWSEPKTVAEPVSQKTYSSSIGDDSKLSQEVLQTEGRNNYKVPKKETKKSSGIAATEELNHDNTNTFKYNLSNPSDARSAFLASEIFNRKY